MGSQGYYVLRSRQDGRHLAAQGGSADVPKSFLLLFGADHEALSYLSTHAPDLRPQFSVEWLAPNQVKDLLARWGFAGVGLVRDALTPQVEFLERDRPF